MAVDNDTTEMQTLEMEATKGEAGGTEFSSGTIICKTESSKTYSRHNMYHIPS